MLGHSFIINSSFTFKLIWNVVSHFIDSKTLKKITFCDSNYIEKLKEFVDLKKFPKILGGECTCPGIKGGCMFSNIGPWM